MFCVIIAIFFYVFGYIPECLFHKPPEFFHDSEQPNHLLGETSQTTLLSENFITALFKKTNNKTKTKTKTLQLKF